MLLGWGPTPTYKNIANFSGGEIKRLAAARTEWEHWREIPGSQYPLGPSHLPRRPPRRGLPAEVSAAYGWLKPTDFRTSRICKRERAQENIGHILGWRLSSTEADMSRNSIMHSNKNRRMVAWSNDPSMTIDTLPSSILLAESAMRLFGTDYGDILAPIPRISSTPAPRTTAQSISSTGVDGNQSLPRGQKERNGQDSRADPDFARWHASMSRAAESGATWLEVGRGGMRSFDKWCILASLCV